MHRWSELAILKAQVEEVAMAGKTPQKRVQKKQGKSLKEKRLAKKQKKSGGS